VEEKVPAQGLFFVDDLGWIATIMDVNRVARKLETCEVESIQWAIRRDLQFHTTTKEAAQFTRRRGHEKHVPQKHTSKIKVKDGFVQFNKEAKRWPGVSMDAHLTLLEHHNSCMKMPRVAEARLCVLTWMPRIVPDQIRDDEIVCVQAVALYGRELWWDPKRLADEKIFNSS
jgi:hypothetical protein